MPGDKVKYISFALVARNLLFRELLAAKGKKESESGMHKNFVLLTQQGYIYNFYYDDYDDKEIIEMYP